METNLELLIEARAGLSIAQMAALDDYLLGALSVSVSRKEWKACLEAAQLCAARMKEVA